MEPQKVLNTDLLDIIFEGRNKQYGAYYLRRIYEKHVGRAMLIGLSLILLGFSAPVIYSKIKGALADLQTEEKKTEVNLAEIEMPVDVPPPPPPPPPDEPPPPPKNTIKYVPPKVEEDKKVVEETPPPKNEDIKEDIAKDTQKGTGETKIADEVVGNNPEPEVKAPVEEDNSVAENAAVEQPAEFPGGQVELMRWLSQNMKFPAIARENNIQGRVVLKFIVEKDGRVSNVTVLKKVHDLLDAEAVRVVKSMPEWKAGKQGGKNVRCYFTLPVSFKLEG